MAEMTPEFQSLIGTVTSWLAGIGEGVGTAETNVGVARAGG